MAPAVDVGKSSRSRWPIHHNHVDPQAPRIESLLSISLYRQQAYFHSMLQGSVQGFYGLMLSSHSLIRRRQHRYQYGCMRSNTLANCRSHLWMRRRRLANSSGLTKGLQVLTGFSSRQICYGG